MARSACPRCGETSFEAVEGKPANQEFRIVFIQCVKCGAVVGAMDYFNIGFLLRCMGESIEATIRAAMDAKLKEIIARLQE